MKQLILIRHGMAISHQSGGRDFNRILEPAGREEARKAGAFLKDQADWQPDRILSSPAPRALATARIVAGELGMDDALIRKAPSIYEASIAELLENLHDIEDQDTTVCLVGHNPGFENLANWLAGNRIIAGLATAGVILLELGVEEWSKVGSGSATLHCYFTPDEGVI